MTVGVDLHTREQSVAMLDTTTGEVQELRIRHDGDAVERFYAALQPPVTVAIESTGYALWFHALMQRLGHTLLVGDAAKLRATVVRRTKTDRRDARHILTLLSEDRHLPECPLPEPATLAGLRRAPAAPCAAPLSSRASCPGPHWHDYLANATLANPICDRLLHNAHGIVLKVVMGRWPTHAA